MNIFRKSIKSSDRLHKVNEDHCLAVGFRQGMEAVNFLCVTDGVGGLDDGEKASYLGVLEAERTFHDGLIRRYLDKDDRYTVSTDQSFISELVRTCIHNANRAVIDSTTGSLERSGSTISISVVTDNFIVVGSVGDSPVYYYRKSEDDLRLVSKIQTQAEEDVENGMYVRDSDEYRDNSSVLKICLGIRGTLDEQDIHVSIIGLPEVGDMLLLGSDGAFGFMDEGEIKEILTSGPARNVIMDLFDRAEMDGSDDQTAILCVI